MSAASGSCAPARSEEPETSSMHFSCGVCVEGRPVTALLNLFTFSLSHSSTCAATGNTARLRAQNIPYMECTDRGWPSQACLSTCKHTRVMGG